MDTRSYYNGKISIQYNSKQSCILYLYLGKSENKFDFQIKIILYAIYLQQ